MTIGSIYWQRILRKEWGGHARPTRGIGRVEDEPSNPIDEALRKDD